MEQIWEDPSLLGTSDVYKKEINRAKALVSPEFVDKLRKNLLSEARARMQAERAGRELIDEDGCPSKFGTNLQTSFLHLLF